jgi:hypothetical protein
MLINPIIGTRSHLISGVYHSTCHILVSGNGYGLKHVILQEVETGQRPEWKDIADRSPTYKSYWAQWKSLAVRNSKLERNLESANGRSTIQ